MRTPVDQFPISGFMRFLLMLVLTGRAFVADGSTEIAQQAYLKASYSGALATLGFAVALSGDTAVVGAPRDGGGGGAVYVFVRSGTTWTQQACLRASNEDALDEFGSSVAISGDTVVVGAYHEASAATGVNGNENDNSAADAGAAYVFVRSGTTWSQQAYLKASNTDARDLFGNSVGVSGDTVVIGACYEDSGATGVNGDQSDNSALFSGAAYVFVRNGTTWSQQAYLKASNTEADDCFGEVAVSGDTVVVGARLEASSANGVNGDQADNSAPRAGAAYVFVRSGTTWSQQAYLKAACPGAEDLFGGSVAVSGNTVVIGACSEDSGATGVNGNENDNSAADAGAAYVFVRSGTTWSQQAYLKASNAGARDCFGGSVAVSGDTVVIGAYSEDSGVTGVNGNENDNSAADAGAAYFFVRSGTTWSQGAFLKASNAGAGDCFGSSVAVSGDTGVVGACYEDSGAIQVNGDQADNYALDAGAAYIFTGLGTPVKLGIAQNANGGCSLCCRGVPDLTYRLLRAASLAGPWETLSAAVAPASGQMEFQDNSLLPGGAFYRIAVGAYKGENP